MGLHSLGAPEVQLPLLQLSPAVQGLLSLHVVPSDAAGFEQVPVVELQVPAM